MLQIVIKFALTHGLAAAGVWAVTNGLTTYTGWESVVGFLSATVAYIIHWHSTHTAAVATGQVPAPQAPTLSPKAAGAAMLFALAMPALLLGGCKLPGDVAHVYHISGDGTSLGVTQNPTTQAYELGLKRIHTTLTIIPIVYQTNALGNITAVIPDTVVSDEINARSGVFGGAGGTITIATGTNAVQTLLGGMHVPINEGTGSTLPK